MRPPSRLPRASLALLATSLLTCGTQGNHGISGTVDGASAVTVSLTGAVTKTATTDGNGGYAFTGLADGAYTVTPAKTGYAFTPGSLAVTLGGADVAGVDFAAAPAPHAIVGTVAGASAVTVNLTGAAIRTTTTDGTGGYAFTDLADGAYAVTPVKTGYTFTPASLAVTVAGAGVADQDFAAAPVPYAITGTVNGASAVTVHLTGRETKTTTTDGSGGYAFTGLADGAYTVTPAKTGYTFTPGSLAVTVAGAGVAGQDFAAAPVPQSISGRVIGASEVKVTLTGVVTRTTVTYDALGGYVFVNLRDGTYTLMPSRAGYSFTPASLTVTLAGGSITGQDFVATLVPRAISGKVTGTTAATVTLTGAATGTATTDSIGGYEFKELPDGAYTVTASKPGYTFTPPSLEVTMTGPGVPGQDFIVNQFTVSGTVTGASAVRVVAYLCSSSDPKGCSTLPVTTPAAEAVTDAAGRFALTLDWNGYLALYYRIVPSRWPYVFTPSHRDVRMEARSGVDFVGTCPSGASCP